MVWADKAGCQFSGVSSQKEPRGYQEMRWMMFRRINAAKVRAIAMAAASTLKASLRVGVGDSMGNSCAWLCRGEKIGLRCTKPTLLGSCAWVLELEAKFEEFA